MRAGVHDAQFFFHNDKFVGINLGWDQCAEHEFGIRPLKFAFDLDEDLIGFAARKVQYFPSQLSLVESGDKTYLVCEKYAYRSTVKEIEHMILSGQWKPDSELLCSWDDESFGIRTVGVVGRERLHSLYKAFQDMDIAIFLGVSQPFGNGGLKLVLYSSIPEESLKAVEESDLDRIKLEKAVEATGIVARLKAASKASKDQYGMFGQYSYFALSPKWLSADWDKKSQYDVIFWLNPMAQKHNNAGWFTVEELDQWIAGEGPVIREVPR